MTPSTDKELVAGGMGGNPIEMAGGAEKMTPATDRELVAGGICIDLILGSALVKKILIATLSAYSLLKTYNNEFLWFKKTIRNTLIIFRNL